eukprot:7341146-Prymnesium_polylepis.1
MYGLPPLSVVDPQAQLAAELLTAARAGNSARFASLMDVPMEPLVSLRDVPMGTPVEGEGAAPASEP